MLSLVEVATLLMLGCIVCICVIEALPDIVDWLKGRKL